MPRGNTGHCVCLAIMSLRTRTFHSLVMSIPACSMIRLISTLGMLLFCEVTWGQNDFNFIALTTKNGLSSNTVNAILQDRNGLVWFATSDGLNKFDGTNFAVYTHNDADSTSIPSNVIKALLQDRSGRLWVGTGGGGLVYYDQHKDVFSSFEGDGGMGKKSQFNVNTLYEDRSGNIWVGTFGGYRVINPKTLKVKNVEINQLFDHRINALAILSFMEDSAGFMWMGTNNGLLRLDLKSNNIEVFLPSPSDPYSISNKNIKTIVKDNQGKIFFGTGNGLSMLLPDRRSFKTFFRSGKSLFPLSEDMIYNASLAPDNKLWIGTEDGVSIFDCKMQTFSSVKPDKRKTFSLSHKSVWSVCIGKTGIIWLGTYQGGVNKLDPNLALFNLKRSNPFDPKGLSSPVVTSFAEYKPGEVFVGTDGGGLHLFDRRTGLFSHIDIKSKTDRANRPLAIQAIELDKQKQLWIGTFQNGLFVYDTRSATYQQFLADNKENGISQNDIFFVKQDSKGLIWIGTNGSGVDVFDPKTRKFLRFHNNGLPKMPLNGFMRAIAEDANGDIWLGSNGTGIAVYHPQNNNFTLYNKKNSQLSDDLVLSMLHDKKGNVWVGTNGGLNLFHRDSGKFTHFKESNGLANSFVYKILEDESGMIWLSTDKGISCIDPITKKIKNFGRPNGVQDSPFVLGSGISTADGELYFGGQDGFNYFSPKVLPTYNVMPDVILTELKVANNTVFPGADAPIQEQISLAKEITLNYGQNFSISYVALNFTAPQQNHYSYKLAGLDKDWNEVGREKTAYYTNLDPGDYVFQVRASNNEGVWNRKITTIAVHVLPPIWRRFYAYLFYIAVIAGLLFYSRQRSIQKIKNTLALQHEKINAQQQIEQHRRESERVHALDIQKIKFLTNLSHEFRTPISLILAPVDKLLSAKLESPVAAQIKMVSRNARRLLNLVNQLLDFRKMEQQELKLNLEKGDLVAFISEAAQAFQDLSDKKKISLTIERSIISLITLFDHDKMERIIFNLLSNAFKFTREGGAICLKISLEETPAHELPILCIAITDTGIGILPEIRERVFERFFMDNSITTILNQGSGIGLSIVKEFIELHGGEITVDSIPEKGTTFLVRIPAPQMDISQEADSVKVENLYENVVAIEELQGEEEPDADTNMATILLVEDNDEFRFHLKDALQPYYLILEATNGKEGWQKALSCHPQLVVSDISMPEMNGISLSQKIKSDKRTSHIPIILLTAISGEEDQIKGLQSGANDYLTKPFNFDILNTKIKNLLLYNRSVKDTYSKQVQVQGKEIEIESGEVKLLNKIVQYIDEKMNNPELSVEDLSKHVGMSRGSLYHKLLEITGLTPIEYIRSVKLKRAVELLEKSDFNVAQIAYMTGFGTPSYFSRLFKSQYNMLPSEYISTKRKDKR